MPLDPQAEALLKGFEEAGAQPFETMTPAQGRVAAQGTAEQVSGAYRFEVLPGVGHFVTDQAGDKVTELLLEFLATASTRS